MKSIHANIVVNKKSFEGKVIFSNKIEKIEIISQNVNKNLGFLLPGFIDLHIHGGGGVDTMDDLDLSPILKTHAKHGTTSLLLTTVTATHKHLMSTFRHIEKKKKNPVSNESLILGIHLEGPFINHEKIGAQPDYIRKFSLEEILELQKISNIKIITIAPEVMTNQMISDLIKNNFVVQIGHSNGKYEDGVNALKLGAKSFTHLFNAMSSFHHRAPGISGAALAHAEYSEIIPDLLHVHPGAIKTALRSIPKLYFVTDATSASGMADGDFKLGTHTVSKCGNGVRLNDGTLAGSALTMYDAFKNLIGSEIQLSIPEASYRLSTIQSELLNIAQERGSIEVNKFADFVLINSNLDLDEVYISGEKV